MYVVDIIFICYYQDFTNSNIIILYKKIYVDCQRHRIIISIMQKQTNECIFMCSNHNKKIEYFCAINQWHFIPLCSSCLPEHTQKHPKNLKVTIQSIQQTLVNYRQQQQLAFKLYKQKKQQISTLITEPKQFKQNILIEQTRILMKQNIDRYFDNLKQQVEKKRKDTQVYQHELLKKLLENVMVDLQQIKETMSIESVQQWAQTAKRIYFKDGAQAYIDQIDQILKDHTSRMYQTNNISYDEHKIKKVQEQMKSSLRSLISLNIEKPKQFKKNFNSEQTKKSAKVVVKPKMCKNCGTQLQYLTEWKKHLICPNCGGKQRNYIKKK